MASWTRMRRSFCRWQLLPCASGSLQRASSAEQSAAVQSFVFIRPCEKSVLYPAFSRFMPTCFKHEQLEIACGCSESWAPTHCFRARCGIMDKSLVPDKEESTLVAVGRMAKAVLFFSLLHSALKPWLVI